MISVSGSSNYALEQLSQLNDDLCLVLLSTRTLATTTCFFFLSRKGFFDQWLIGELLEGCVAIWDGKTHVRCVHVYITISEHNKVSDKTLMLQRRGYRQS